MAANPDPYHRSHANPQAKSALFNQLATRTLCISGMLDIFCYKFFMVGKVDQYSQVLSRLLFTHVYLSKAMAGAFLHMSPHGLPLSYRLFRFPKSAAKVCNPVNTYAGLTDGNLASYDLVNSYSFKMRYYMDEEVGLEEDVNGVVKIKGDEISPSYENLLGNLEEDNELPKNIYLDKSTMINLLLRKYNYDIGVTEAKMKRRRKSMKLSELPATGSVGELREGKANSVLLDINEMMEGVNQSTLQYIQEHFQATNLQDYNDFFHRYILIGDFTRVLRPAGKLKSTLLKYNKSSFGQPRNQESGEKDSSLTEENRPLANLEIPKARKQLQGNLTIRINDETKSVSGEVHKEVEDPLDRIIHLRFPPEKSLTPSSALSPVSNSNRESNLQPMKSILNPVHKSLTENGHPLQRSKSGNVFETNEKPGFKDYVNSEEKRSGGNDTTPNFHLVSTNVSTPANNGDRVRGVMTQGTANRRLQQEVPNSRGRRGTREAAAAGEQPESPGAYGVRIVRSVPRADQAARSGLAHRQQR